MATLPSGRIVLDRQVSAERDIQLQQRPLPDGSTAFEIIADGVFLMASYNQAGERALAERALGGAAGGRVLVGGLGMGFTLQAVLGTDVTTVEVVEIDPAIIAWNRTYFGLLNGDALADPRLRLIRSDLYDLLTDPPATTYRAVLLDVDNGPSWLARPANGRLYTAAALARWAAILKPGGVFAVWAAQAEPAFLTRLQATFPSAEEIPITTAHHPDHTANDFIYLGVKS